MKSLTRAIKHSARILHQNIKKSDNSSWNRIAAKKDFCANNGLTDYMGVQRKHCLSFLATELGFNSWNHFCQTRDGKDSNFGTLFYPNRCYGQWNIWIASYSEAIKVKVESKGFLVPYLNQFIIVDRDYIFSLGLHPDDPLWLQIGNDWVQPKNLEARNQLFKKLIQANLKFLDEVT